MKYTILVFLLCISIAVYAVDIVPGRAIMHSKVEINVLQEEPYLVTDQAWFNEKIASESIVSIKNMWDRELPPSLNDSRLFYYITYDETRNPDDVVNSLRSEANVNTVFPDLLLYPNLNSNDEYVTS
ncbi:MAG TPA: hypothetical protein PLX77_04340, partial [Candidatus Cloacimonadota bacterium]|nr:hypothetical protein [Candidatus Cloacimonadota bacterium]